MSSAPAASIRSGIRRRQGKRINVDLGDRAVVCRKCEKGYHTLQKVDDNVYEHVRRCPK